MQAPSAGAAEPGRHRQRMDARPEQRFIGIDVAYAAEQGLVEAQHYLGVCYGKGIGVDRSGPEALKWWKKAAEQRYRESYFALAIIYLTGDLMPRDEKEAVKWLRGMFAFACWNPSERRLLVDFARGKLGSSTIRPSQTLEESLRELKAQPWSISVVICLDGPGLPERKTPPPVSREPPVAAKTSPPPAQMPSALARTRTPLSSGGVRSGTQAARRGKRIGRHRR